MFTAAALAAEGEPASPGLLEGASLQGTEEFRFRYWQEPERLDAFPDRPVFDYVETVDRLDLAVTTGSATLGLRADAVALWGNRYYLDGVEYVENPLYLQGVSSPWEHALVQVEKVYAQFRARRGAVELGDTYASFGRGYALNLVKNTDIDVDTSITGVKADLRGARWEATVLSGLTNPQQVALENPNRAIQPNLAHAVTGGRVAAFGLGKFNLSAHGALFQFQPARGESYDALNAWSAPVGAATGGGAVEAIGLGGIDWYLEVDGFAYPDEALGAPGGYAAYLSGSAYPGRTSITLEAKRTSNTEPLNTHAAVNDYEFASGPTLEYDRVITEDSSAAVNSNDLWGARVRADFSLGHAGDAGHPVVLIPYVSLAAFRDLDLGGLHFNRSPETIGHLVGGVQWFKGDFHLLATAGARVDLRDPGPEDYGADRMQHADATLTLPVAKGLAVELAPAFLNYQWGVNPQQQADYLDFSNALALKVGTPWVFVAYTDYSDNPLIDSTGNLGESWYGGGEVQWKPNSATTLKAFYGAYRAGIRCAGGQCRQLPGFSGTKVSLTTTF